MLMIIMYNHVNMFCEKEISFILWYHSWDRMNIEDLLLLSIQNHDNIYPVVTPLITNIMISGGYFYVWPNIMSTLDISKFCQISYLSMFRTRCLSISQAFVIPCYVHSIVHRYIRAGSFIMPWIINTHLGHKTRY